MKKLLLFAAIISAAFTASARSWAPAGDNIMTPWAEDVHHYPGPAMNAFEGKMVNVIGEYGYHK